MTNMNVYRMSKSSEDSMRTFRKTDNKTVNG